VKQYDVIVVGGGHAGVEAALAAGRMGAATALVTFRKDDLGVMSCNPAFGGLGKGHLVREIDALDGAMGRASDYAAIQYRLLNRSKGPAVQGPRVQADRARYLAAIQKIVANAPLVDVVEAEVTALVISGDTVSGVQINGETMLHARAVVLTTGTFLGGKVFIGNKNFPAGRMGNAASTILAQQLRGMGLPMGRLKTGTPPRLRRTSIDWDSLEQQPGDDIPEYMSFLTDRTIAPQVSCAITHTNPQTHDIVRANLDRSAMYGGISKVLGRGIARLSKIKSVALPIKTRTKCSWSLKAWTMILCIQTASPRRCLSRCKRLMCAPFAVWSRLRSPSPDTRLSMTTSTRALWT